MKTRAEINERDWYVQTNGLTIDEEEARLFTLAEASAANDVLADKSNGNRWWTKQYGREADAMRA